MKGDPRFIALLAGRDLKSLDTTPDVIFGLWPNFTLALFNDG